MKGKGKGLNAQQGPTWGTPNPGKGTAKGNKGYWNPGKGAWGKGGKGAYNLMDDYSQGLSGYSVEDNALLFPTGVHERVAHPKPQEDLQAARQVWSRLLPYGELWSVRRLVRMMMAYQDPVPGDVPTGQASTKESVVPVSVPKSSVVPAPVLNIIWADLEMKNTIGKGERHQGGQTSPASVNGAGGRGDGGGSTQHQALCEFVGKHRQYKGPPGP